MSRLSVLMPVRDPRPRHFRRAVASVLAQTSEAWQLCIVDDASERAQVRSQLAGLGTVDRRIRIERHSRPGGIAAATNSALSLADAPYVAFLDHDDELHPQAVELVLARLREDPVDVVYTDEDKITGFGRRDAPFLKPAWSPELLECVMYLGHLLVVRRDLLVELGGISEGVDGAQDYDLALRLFDRGASVRHLPHVLYHWRAHRRSTARAPAAKPGSTAAAVRALGAHYQRRGERRTVSCVHETGLYRARLRAPALAPVSAVFTPDSDTLNDQSSQFLRCIDVIGRHDQVKAAVVVAGPEAAARAQRLLEDVDAEIISAPGDTSRSELIGLGVGRGGAGHNVIFSRPVLPVCDDWLSALAEYWTRPDVGVVGAVLTDRSGRIEHVGVGFTEEGVPVLPDYGRRWDRAGMTTLVARNFLAATGVLGVATNAYRTLEPRPTSTPPLTELELCLRLGAAGLRTVVTPFARFETLTPKPLFEDQPSDRPLRGLLNGLLPDGFVREPA